MNALLGSPPPPRPVLSCLSGNIQEPHEDGGGKRNYTQRISSLMWLILWSRTGIKILSSYSLLTVLVFIVTVYWLKMWLRLLDCGCWKWTEAESGNLVWSLENNLTILRRCVPLEVRHRSVSEQIRASVSNNTLNIILNLWYLREEINSIDENKWSSNMSDKEAT